MASLFSALIICTLLLTISADEAKFGPNIKVGVVSHATTYTGKTNYSDVFGLATLCTQYPLLEEANPDPCFPPVWSWIRCNSDPRPRIIALNLRSRLLFGALPDFSMMDALTSIDLQQNSLYGIIPSFLGDFPHLQTLNLAYNLFTGLVPDSIACNTNLKLSLDGNYGLYTTNSCSSGGSSDGTPGINTAIPTTTNTQLPDYSGNGRRKSRTPVIVGTTVSISGIIGIAFGIFAIFRHKAKVAAAVAAANAQDSRANDGQSCIHTGETPLHPRAPI